MSAKTWFVEKCAVARFYWAFDYFSVIIMDWNVGLKVKFGRVSFRTTITLVYIPMILFLVFILNVSF